MVREALKKIGLSEGEINVYLALLELGCSASGKITQKSGVSGSKVYEVLDRLIAKGFVSKVVKNNVMYFEASSPERILDYLDERKEEIDNEKVGIEKIIPELILKQKGSGKGDVKVFMGWEGLKTANEDIISSLGKGDEWLSMGLSEQPESWEIYFTKRQKVRADKGIKHRHLLNEKYKLLYKNRKKLSHTEFRFLPAELEMPTSTEIYGDKVLIFVLVPESPMAIMIENKHVADSFRKYFEVLWKRQG